MKDDKYNNYFSDGQIDYFLLNDDYIIGPTTEKSRLRTDYTSTTIKNPWNPENFGSE